MSDTNINVKLTQYERPEHIFPTLNATQIARLGAWKKARGAGRRSAGGTRRQ